MCVCVCVVMVVGGGKHAPNRLLFWCATTTRRQVAATIAGTQLQVAVKRKNLEPCRRPREPTAGLHTRAPEVYRGDFLLADGAALRRLLAGESARHVVPVRVRARVMWAHESNSYTDPRACS